MPETTTRTLLHQDTGEYNALNKYGLVLIQYTHMLRISVTCLCGLAGLSIVCTCLNSYQHMHGLKYEVRSDNMSSLLLCMLWKKFSDEQNGSTS